MEVTYSNWTEWQKVKVIKPFCLDQNFDPKALSAPVWGYVHVKKKTLKKVYKIRVQIDFFKICNKWSKW